MTNNSNIIKKVYIDSPVFTEEDEKIFRFVDPDWNSESPDKEDEYTIRNSSLCDDGVVENVKNLNLNRIITKNVNYPVHQLFHNPTININNKNKTKYFDEDEDEMVEKAEVLKVKETKRLQREEAIKNNIPQLDLVDSDEEMCLRDSLEVENLKENLAREQTGKIVEKAQLQTFFLNNLKNEYSEDYKNICNLEQSFRQDNNFEVLAYASPHYQNHLKSKPNTSPRNTLHLPTITSHQSKMIGDDNHIKYIYSQTKPSENSTSARSVNYDNNKSGECSDELNQERHKDFTADSHITCQNNNNKLENDISAQTSSKYFSADNLQKKFSSQSGLKQKLGVDSHYIYDKKKPPKSYTKMLSQQLNKKTLKKINLSSISPANNKVKEAKQLFEHFTHEKDTENSSPRRYSLNVSSTSQSRCTDVSSARSDMSKVEETWSTKVQLLEKISMNNLKSPQNLKRYTSDLILNENLQKILQEKDFLKLEQISKTISAPGPVKRRPPHRILPLESELKVISISAPLNRKVRVLTQYQEMTNSEENQNTQNSKKTRQQPYSDRGIPAVSGHCKAAKLTDQVLETFSNFSNEDLKMFSEIYLKNASAVQLRKTESQTEQKIVQNPMVTGSEADLSTISVTSVREKFETENYKQYKVEDYKKLKAEIQLGINIGSLGPDLQNESYKEKREKAERQKLYSQQILIKNKVDLEASKRKKQQLSSDVKTEEQLNDKRKMALEYAKHVPKPKPAVPKTVSNIHDFKHEEIPYRNYEGDEENISKKDILLNDVDVKWLKERHDIERQKIASFAKS